MRSLGLFAALALLGWAPSAAAQQSRLEQARQEIERLIAESGAAVVGVAVYDTQTKQTLLINERENFQAASTMNLPVMMEVFRLIKARKLSPNDPIEVKNKFYSIVDGSEYRLSKDNDSDEELYRRVGQMMTIAELVDHMITWNSNLATNLLLEKVGAENIQRLMRQLGAQDLQVLCGVEDAKASRAGKNNTVTAYDLMLLLRLLAEKKFLDSRACQQMIEILSTQQRGGGIPAGLPAATRVAHQTGSLNKISHDAAIVYAPGRKPYVIVLLTSGIASQRRAERLIADISRAVYQALAAVAFKKTF